MTGLILCGFPSALLWSSHGKTQPNEDGSSGATHLGGRASTRTQGLSEKKDIQTDRAVELTSLKCCPHTLIELNF